MSKPHCTVSSAHSRPVVITYVTARKLCRLGSIASGSTGYATRKIGLFIYFRCLMHVHSIQPVSLSLVRSLEANIDLSQLGAGLVAIGWRACPAGASGCCSSDLHCADGSRPERSRGTYCIYCQVSAQPEV